MKIDALTQTLTPNKQAKKAECCPPLSSFSLTGPDRDTLSFGMSPAAEAVEVAEEVGLPRIITIAEGLPRPKLPTEDLLPKNVEETTNPFKKFVEDITTPKIAKVIPDETTVNEAAQKAAQEAAKLAELQKVASMSANAGF